MEWLNKFNLKKMSISKILTILLVAANTTGVMVYGILFVVSTFIGTTDFISLLFTIFFLGNTYFLVKNQFDAR